MPIMDPGDDPRQPARPVVRIPPRTQEVKGELEGYLDRLAMLGATDDELLAVIETWDVFDAEWTPATRKRTTRASDDELHTGLLNARAEYLHDTTYDPEIWQPGMDTPSGSVEELLAWVGGDPDRAYAVYETERGRDEWARAELLRVLTPIKARI